jgi:hypothetical protein
MKNIFLILFSVLFAYSCADEQMEDLFGTTDERAGIMRSSAAMVAVGDSVMIEVTLMNTADSTRLLAVSGNHYEANSFLLAGGRLGKAYKSDEDGDNWTPSIGGTYYGPMRTVNALSWSRATRNNTWARCVAACNEGIWYYDALSDYWYSLLQGDEYVFTAAGYTTDSRLYENNWHIAGLKNGVPCLYRYMFFSGGSYTYFSEMDATMFEYKITDMTGTYGENIFAVTVGGEVGIASTYGTYEIVNVFDTALYAVSFLMESNTDSTKVFVGGKNGFMAYAQTNDYYTWYPASSGITSRINSIATASWEIVEQQIIVAGGNGGQFSYSLDNGGTFIPYDIGFGTDNINDITYYEYDGCFYAVGDHGKIARIKITINQI